MAATGRRAFPAGSIEFFTDVEGNFEYFDMLVDRSNIVCWKDRETRELDFESENTVFVHGGDLVDKGPGDIRVVKALTSLKRRYPDRVFLILGNRDVNKLRLASELKPGTTGSSIHAYWNPKCVTYDDYVKTLKPEEISENPRVNILRWILNHTMGCQTTFYTRRVELSVLQGTSIEDVTDDEVLDSFVSSVLPSAEDAFMLEYVKLGQIMLLLGDCLFFHGALKPQCLGAVPYDNKIQEFEADPYYRTVDGKRIRNGHGLIDYGVPNGFENKTIIYQTWLNNGNLEVPEAQVVEYLRKNNVRRVFTGHVPSGDCPNVMRVADDLMVVMGDTSYSDHDAPKDFNPANNRGAIASNINIMQLFTFVNGNLRGDSKHGYKLYADGKRSQVPDTLVGRQLQNQYWIRTVREDGKLIAVKGEGFKLHRKELMAEEVVAALHSDFQLTRRGFFHKGYLALSAACVAVFGLYLNSRFRKSKTI